MLRVTSDGYIAFISRLLPFRISRFNGRISSILNSCSIFINPESFFSFLVASFAYPLTIQIISILYLPEIISLPIILSMLLIQSLPIIILIGKRERRRRGIEAELPFAIISLYILSHESFPNLRSALAKIASLGRKVFPSFLTEHLIIERNLIYNTSNEFSAIERSIASNPSEDFRRFVHNYLATLFGGSDVHAFVKSEAERFISMLEEKWRSFTHSLYSLIEISFVLLSILPIGIQMVASTFFGQGSSYILLFSFIALGLLALILLAIIDMIQPLLNNGVYSISRVFLLLSTWLSLNILYLLGYIQMHYALLISSLLSLILLLNSGPFFRRFNSATREVAMMLHELAEMIRAGSTLPASIESLLKNKDRYTSLKYPLIEFATLLKIGYLPHEAQRKIEHSSWMVRVAFAVLTLCLETGAGFEQLERLSLFFRRISDVERSFTSSVFPFFIMGISVPIISCASVWLLSGIGGAALSFMGITSQINRRLLAISISLNSILTGMIISKAYSHSIRSLIGYPPILFATFSSFLIFNIS